MKRKHFDALLGAALLAVVVSGFSYTWTPMGAGSGGPLISMSADGRIICGCPSTGGQLRISRDHGQTWFIATNAPSGGSFSGNPVALSADGSQIIACLSSNGQAVFLSNDVGTNWAKLSLPTLSGFSSYCVACSANGSNLIAAADSGSVYFSTNSGANWSTASAPSTNWISVASSADGRRMAGAVRGGRLYFSTNFGSTWTPSNLSTQLWSSVCISADGKSIGAIGTNTYISRNEGASWLTNAISGSSVGNTIACSADGATWMIAGAQIYTSSDSGVTWSTNLSTGFWSGAMSVDGCEIAVKGPAAEIGYVTPAPLLHIRTSNNNLGISWLLPSTNFVLQQSSEIAAVSWTAVTNNPTLNFTNLNLELNLLTITTNTFFRLMAQ